MRVRILAVGTRMPEWVTTAYEDYTRRMRKDMRVDLEEIPVGRVKADEEKRLLERIGDDYLVALSYQGDVVIFKGYDPDTAGSDPNAFQLHGIWYVGAVPVGHRQVFESEDALGQTRTGPRVGLPLSQGLFSHF